MASTLIDRLKHYARKAGTVSPKLSQREAAGGETSTATIPAARFVKNIDNVLESGDLRKGFAAMLESGDTVKTVSTIGKGDDKFRVPFALSAKDWREAGEGKTDNPAKAAKASTPASVTGEGKPQA